ncbi:MAG: hypothetical protein JJ992_03915, partial [Planctomycetes bacterium]|nr:hypothetical protein [Planctomycetota bacterium]
YIFSEYGQQITSGDAAGIGFWQNKHGQELIKLGGSALADWLTGNFGNIFGSSLVGASGDDVAHFYRDQLFKKAGKKVAGPPKMDAQFMAVALATFFTSSELAGNAAAPFGFNVTDTGIGTHLVNVGSNGVAFGVANDRDVAVLQLLLAANDRTGASDDESGFASLYDADRDGTIDGEEALLRTMAHELFSNINERGSI